MPQRDVSSCFSDRTMKILDFLVSIQSQSMLRNRNLAIFLNYHLYRVAILKMHIHNILRFLSLLRFAIR